MRFQNPTVLTFSLCALLAIAGCGKTKSGDAKPAKTGDGHAEEHHGPNGGMMFDVGQGHKILGEIVLKTEPRKLELFLVDHNDKTKAVISTSKTVTIRSIKVKGKPVADITFDMEPLKTDEGGTSHFVAAGEKVPSEIADGHDFEGATFSLMIDGKQVLTTIHEH